MKIVKMRVGKVLDLTTNELLYNVEHYCPKKFSHRVN